MYKYLIFSFFKYTIYTANRKGGNVIMLIIEEKVSVDEQNGDTYVAVSVFK